MFDDEDLKRIPEELFNDFTHFLNKYGFRYEETKTIQSIVFDFDSGEFEYNEEDKNIVECDYKDFHCGKCQIDYMDLIEHIIIDHLGGQLLDED